MDSNKYKKTRKKIKKKKSIYIQTGIWLSTSLVLLLINLLTSPFHLWALYPFLGWGLAIIIQVIQLKSKSWEEKELQKIDANNIEALDLEEELELREFKKLRREWDDSEFV